MSEQDPAEEETCVGRIHQSRQEYEILWSIFISMIEGLCIKVTSRKESRGEP